MSDVDDGDPLAGPVAKVASDLMAVTGSNGHNTVGRSPVDGDDEFPEDEPFEAQIRRARYRPASVSEGEVTRECLEWCNAQPKCRARKVHQGAMAGAGEPDLDICWHGRTVKIEVKAPGGSRNAKPTPAQNARLLWWQDAGALVGWVNSLAQLRDILAKVGDPGYRYDGRTPGAVA